MLRRTVAHRLNALMYTKIQWNAAAALREPYLQCSRPIPDLLAVVRPLLLADVGGLLGHVHRDLDPGLELGGIPAANVADDASVIGAILEICKSILAFIVRLLEILP